jgi:hypothetical protein
MGLLRSGLAPRNRARPLVLTICRSRLLIPVQRKEWSCANRISPPGLILFTAPLWNWTRPEAACQQREIGLTPTGGPPGTSLADAAAEARTRVFTMIGTIKGRLTRSRIS